MLVSLQSYTLLHFKRKQLLRWNVCQLSEDRNIRNIPSVTKGETHTNRLSFRLNKHKVSYFRLLRFYFRAALTLGERRAWVGVPAWAWSRSWGTAGLGGGETSGQGTAGMVTPTWHNSSKSVTDPWNHRIILVGKALYEHQVQLFPQHCHSHCCPMSPKATSTGLWNPSRDGDSTTALGSPFGEEIFPNIQPKPS